MKNKVLNYTYLDFTLDKLLITIPQMYYTFNINTNQYDKGLLYYPENMRIINNTDMSIYYNMFEHDLEYGDYTRDNTNLYDHIEIKTLGRDRMKSLMKIKYLHIYVTSAFTDSIQVEFFDYKFK